MSKGCGTTRTNRPASSLLILEHPQSLCPEESKGFNLVGRTDVAAGADNDQMVEAELQDRLEALDAMRGGAGDGESIDERVVEILCVARVRSRMPRHVVRFADF